MAEGTNPTRQPGTDEVRAQVARITESPAFVHSERLCRFLRVAVQRTLDGQPDELKEYNLARDVFDRPEQFDPRVDSIVRVEARRLRSKLRSYYEKYGQQDRIMIAFAPGSYVPEFRERRPEAAAVPVQEQEQAADPNTVAVLPFLDLGSDPEQAYLCDALAEEIIHRLDECPTLKVIARTSSFSFKNRNLDIRDIGRRLGAGTVVEGSVRQAGDQLRVSVAAIDAVTGSSLWSETYDRRATDLFAVEEEIAQRIAEALRVKLAAHASPALHAGGLEAYTLYLKGTHAWNQANPVGFDRAIEIFSKATSLYPDYAPPYAALADVYLAKAMWGNSVPSAALHKGLRSALEALRLDPGLGHAYAILGVSLSRYRWDWDGADLLVNRCLQMAPRDVLAHFYRAFCLLPRGRFEEAAECLQRALELDPLSHRVNRTIGWMHYLERRYDDAAWWFQRSVELGDDSLAPHFYFVQTYLRAGRLKDALREAQQYENTPAGSMMRAVIGEAYALNGDAREARRILRELDTRAEEHYVDSFGRAILQGALQDWESALRWLERAVTERSLWASFIARDPRFDVLRNDPRFTRLLDRMNLS